jgi:hypothetical protein
MHGSDMKRRRLIGGSATVADGLGERAREVQHDDAKAVVHVAAVVGAWSSEDVGGSELEPPAMADGCTGQKQSLLSSACSTTLIKSDRSLER